MVISDSMHSCWEYITLDFIAIPDNGVKELYNFK